MIRTLVKLALLIVAVLVGYNYFFGNAEEKEQSREILSDVKDLSAKAVDLLRQEKVNYEEGKYDGALDKIGGLFDKIRQKAEVMGDDETLTRLRELEAKRRALEHDLENKSVPEAYEKSGSNQSRNSIEHDFEDLIRETEALSRNAGGE